jgi:electron transfer flavoprotein beta subunit
MRIIVCVKPVPDPKQWDKLRLDPKTMTLIRTGIDLVANPLDKHALEAALQIKEKLGGEVKLLSMAPPDSSKVLRECLAMGADEAILLSDRAFAGSDTLGTAHVLAQAIQAMGGCDLVICGDETIDGGTAQVSAQIAEYLQAASIMHISQIEPKDDGSFMVHSQVEKGYRKIAAKPPLVLSVVHEINTPRYVTMMNVLEAEGKPLETWTGENVCVDEACVGLADSPTQMAGLFEPPKKKHAEMLTGVAQEQAKQLADKLHRLGYC